MMRGKNGRPSIINTDPTRRQLDQFGFIWMAFFTAAGVMAWLRAGRPAAAAVLWVAALGVPALGWAWPRFMRLVFLGMSYAAWPVGFVVSHVVLAVAVGSLTVLPGLPPQDRREPHEERIRANVLAVTPAGPNLVVIHTPPGEASAVALALDRLAPAGLVGTVAGDDTIFAAVESARAGRELVRRLKALAGTGR